MIGVSRWTAVAAGAGVLLGSLPLAAIARADESRHAHTGVVSVAAPGAPTPAPETTAAPAADARNGAPTDADDTTAPAPPQSTGADVAPPAPEPAAPAVPAAPAAPSLAAPESYAPVTVTTTNTFTYIVVTAPITLANGPVTTVVAPAAPCGAPAASATPADDRPPRITVVLMSTRPDAPPPRRVQARLHARTLRQLAGANRRTAAARTARPHQAAASRRKTRSEHAR
jgi:hypothetical protein